MEPSLRDHVERMLARLHDLGRRHEVVELHHMMIACASDIVTLHAFGESFRFLDQPDFGQSYFAASGVLLDMTHIFAAVPWLAGLAVSTPGWLAKWMNPSLSQFVDRKDVRLPLPFEKKKKKVLLLTSAARGSGGLIKSERYERATTTTELRTAFSEVS
jgi:hypothetical protein